MRITLLTYLAKERRGGRVRHAHQGMNGARNAPYKPRSLDVARRNPGATRGPGFHFIPSGLRLLGRHGRRARHPPGGDGISDYLADLFGQGMRLR